MQRRSLFLLTLLSLSAFALPARAYLDPASGSMVLQLLLGGLAGMAVVIKLYWHRLLGLFGIRKRENGDSGA